MNERQADGFTPLHGPAQNGQVEMIELLMAHGADANAANDRGQTAVDWLVLHAAATGRSAGATP